MNEQDRMQSFIRMAIIGYAHKGKWRPPLGVSVVGILLGYLLGRLLDP